MQLLKGLDVTVLKLSEVVRENRVFRIDAQFFSKAAISTELILKRGEWQSLGQASSRIESFGAYALTNSFTYIDKGIPFLRCVNIKGGFTDLSNCLFISPEAHAILRKSVVEPGMVLFTMSGSVGESAVALPSWTYPINSNQDIAKITPIEGISPYFLVAFLNSRYGRIQAERLPVGSVQQHIFLWMLDELVIVRRFSEKLEAIISKEIERTYELRAGAGNYFKRAAEELEAALGLLDWEPPDPLTYAARASEVFAAKRIDAEHWRPKFAALIDMMMRHGEVVRLGDYLSFCERGRQPSYAESGTPVINSRHVRGGIVELDSENRLADEDIRMNIRYGDILMNGTGVGTIGRCAAYLHAQMALPDNHVTILRLSPDADLDPVFLATQLDSFIGQLQVEQHFKGSSGQIELYPSEIRDFRIWRAPKDIQQRIRGHMESGHGARLESQAVMENARRAVEIAIDESESAALKYLSGTDHAES